MLECLKNTKYQDKEPKVTHWTEEKAEKHRMRDEAERSTKQLMLFQSPAQLSVNTECSISEGFHGYTGFPPTPSEHIHKISPGSRTISSANTAT